MVGLSRHEIARILEAPPPRTHDTYHRLSELDVESKQATCSKCGRIRMVKRSGYEWRCVNAKPPRYFRPKVTSPPHRKFLGNRRNCERCDFEAVHKSQLDVHHKDRNHANNDRSNIEILCANCHRLEHFGP